MIEKKKLCACLQIHSTHSKHPLQLEIPKIMENYAHMIRSPMKRSQGVVYSYTYRRSYIFLARWEIHNLTSKTFDNLDSKLISVFVENALTSS